MHDKLLEPAVSRRAQQGVDADGGAGLRGVLDLGLEARGERAAWRMRGQEIECVLTYGARLRGLVCGRDGRGEREEGGDAGGVEGD